MQLLACGLTSFTCLVDGITPGPPIPPRGSGEAHIAAGLSLKGAKPEWKRLADLPQGMSAAPSAALPAGVSHLLMLGGVSADYWRQQFEDRPELNGAGEGHPGFEGTLWAYDTITDTWAEAGELPAEAQGIPVSVPVTTPVVAWKDKFIVPTGEMKPGIRHRRSSWLRSS